ncbi:DNA polymerase-3 subunit beta [Paenibacillus sp. yr247]|uniref:DNA polymerase III subunit beta n=1 Tax=Paenibacillus sp. yr247 TaxID=1761880 RepID=UPI000890FA60|nr:DNA polymerase III subunit beta [Paenibacillus sp. yr247]SDO16758.1 DNA polymerase-3 subunit beta [Paenibacillus sp. yr247]
MTTATKEKTGVTIAVKDTGRFGSKVSLVADACASSNTIPILTCMKIEMKAGNVLFTGGDGVKMICMGERDVVHAEVDTSFAVPAKLFKEIINKLPAGEVRLTITENMLLIRAGNVKFDISLLDVKEYPAFVVDKNDVSTFMIPASALIAALKSTMYACAVNQAMPIITGVCMESREGASDLIFTATDRNRLARYVVSDIAADPFRIPISLQSCMEIKRIFEGEETELKVTATASIVSVMGPGTMFMSRILEGDYPNTDKLFPQAFEMEISMEREKLLGALTRASVFAKNKKMAVFTLKNDEVSIESKAEVGQVMDSLSCQTNGKEMRLGLDVFFLIEALKAIDQKNVRIGFTSPVTPLVIRPEDETIKSIGLLIPIRPSA